MELTNATRPMTLQTALDELIAARPDSYISVSSDVHRWSGSQWEVDFKIYDAKADNGTSEVYEARTLEAAMFAWRQANFPANVSATTEAADVFADAEALATPVPVGEAPQQIPDGDELADYYCTKSDCKRGRSELMACRREHPEFLQEMPF